MVSMKTGEWVALAILFLMVLTAFGVYWSLPEQIVFIWDGNSKVLGYIDKTLAIFGLPLFSILLYGFLRWLPNLDPNQRFREMQTEYVWFTVAVVGFLFYYYGMMIFYNLKGLALGNNQFISSWGMNIASMLMFGIAFLLFALSEVIHKSSPVHVFGIKTNATLSSETIWKETHERAGWMLKSMAIIAGIGIFAPDFVLKLLLVAIVVGSIYLVVYSDYLYKKMNEKQIVIGKRKNKKKK